MVSAFSGKFSSRTFPKPERFSLAVKNDGNYKIIIMLTIHVNDTNLSRIIACLHQIDFFIPSSLSLAHLLLLLLFIKSIKETMSKRVFAFMDF